MVGWNRPARIPALARSVPVERQYASKSPPSTTGSTPLSNRDSPVTCQPRAARTRRSGPAAAAGPGPGCRCSRCPRRRSRAGRRAAGRRSGSRRSASTHRVHHHRPDHPVRRLRCAGSARRTSASPDPGCWRRPARGRRAPRWPRSAGRRPARTSPGLGCAHPAAGRRTSGGNPVGQHRGEPLGGDAAVGRRQRPAVGREGHVVRRPAVADQRLDQPFVADGSTSRRERGPDVVAADRASSTTASRSSGRRRVRARATRPPARPPPRMARSTGRGRSRRRYSVGHDVQRRPRRARR